MKISVIVQSAYVRWIALMVLCYLVVAAFVLLGFTPRSDFPEQAALLIASFALLRTFQNEGK